MHFLDFANTFVGLLTGLVTLILGILKLLPDIRRLINRLTRKAVLSVAQVNRAQKWGRVLGILLLLVSAGLFAARIDGQGQLPLNADLTVRAWKALDAGNPARAIALADSCIDEFGALAEIQQAQCDSLRAPQPPTEAVPDSTKAQLFSRGPLNDVATCWFIKGKALERFGQKVKACEAYKVATHFPHARCWDPKGWFWSPAEAAAARRLTLKC